MNDFYLDYRLGRCIVVLPLARPAKLTLRVSVLRRKIIKKLAEKIIKIQSDVNYGKDEFLNR